MEKKDLTITMLVDQTPEEVFNAVNNVRGWWGEGIQGGTEKLNDEFRYRHEDIHDTTQKLVEVVPNKRVVWLVTKGELSFIKDKNEWEGTKVVFDISKKGNQTQLVFTHVGLTPDVECYEACHGGWTYYVDSLNKLITTGVGHPDDKSIATAKMAK